MSYPYYRRYRRRQEPTPQPKPFYQKWQIVSDENASCPIDMRNSRGTQIDAGDNHPYEGIPTSVAYERPDGLFVGSYSFGDGWVYYPAKRKEETATAV